MASRVLDTFIRSIPSDGRCALHALSVAVCENRGAISLFFGLSVRVDAIAGPAAGASMRCGR